MTDYTSLAERGSLEKAIAALGDRGVAAELVETRTQALERLIGIIPSGATLMTGASATLREIGFEAEIAREDHGWIYLRPGILAEKDLARQMAMRRGSSLADCFVGSVQALTENGEIVAASGSGSQLAAYAYSSSRVVWVVGGQKVVLTLEDALRRVREHCTPKVQEMAGGMGRPELGVLGKILIFEREMPYVKRTVHLILMNEAIGF